MEKRPLMKKSKALIFLGAAILLMLTVVTPPIYTTKIEGVITDATSGEPLSDIIIDVSWGGQQPGIVDTTTISLHHETVITDSSGRYEIPTVIFLKPFYKRLRDISFSVYHPLYEVKRWNWLWTKSPDDPLGYRYAMKDKQRWQPLSLDIPLLHVRDLFKDENAARDFSYFLSAKRPLYWASLKKKYGIRYDLNQIALEYTEINNNVSPSRKLRDLEMIVKKIDELVTEGY